MERLRDIQGLGLRISRALQDNAVACVVCFKRLPHDLSDRSGAKGPF